ncbi:hypothetical protein A5773_04180 [Mycobacterium sp. 852014-52450_SCH5900713]|nr:hypothetical protein A5773_04180 [Mycobacterium sp. 852014-52450_SCH5900713]
MKTTKATPPAADADRVAALVAARAGQAVRARRRPATPAELAARIMPGYRITPTIALISDALAEAVGEPGRRLIVSVPPREGKSTLVSQVGPPYALMTDPNNQVVLVSYADALAQEHSGEARARITEHADLLGYQLRADKQAVGRWKVDGHDGGLLAAGILSGITGFGADLLIVDDPVKNAQEADSPAYRRRVIHEFRSTLLTRLHPNASVVLIMTRWHPEDLAGVLLAEEPDRWRHINIPAIAEAGIPDALGRTPGVAMTSALGRTAEQFDDLRRGVGQRTWYSLYEGVPAAPEGGLIKRQWLDDWRLPAAPQRPLLTVVGVDPSDSGSGDSCGLVAASMTAEGVIAVIADQSAPMTSDQWARAAVELAAGVGASEIAVEGFAARETYTRVVNDALKRYRIERPVKVTSWPPKGSGRGGGDALARSAALLQGLEVGTCRLAGHFPAFEEAAVTWQAGQHQPDGLAALVVAHDVLVHAAGRQWSFASPLETERRLADRRQAAASGLARRVTDRPAITPIGGYLRRRISG